MARAKKNKPTVTTILLVVEGTTEKIYFERLKGLERYSSLKIRPDLPKHSNLTTLLDYAKNEQASGAYDYVWLLFDRDVLQTQKLPKTTLDLIDNPEKLKKQGIDIADSMPCFEIWFLLHYCLPKQTYQNQDKLIEELCKHIPNYCKNQDWLDKNDIYAMLKDKIDTAIKNSETLRGRNKNADSSDYSMCNVDLLIEKIQELGKHRE
ncbi:MAG: RloB family protein [Treponema sp.]|nr:RloB family protein [Treponema sp.]